MTRAYLAFALILLALPTRLAADAAEDLGDAISAIRTGAWSFAAARAERAGGIAPDIVEWHALRAGRGDFDDALDFLERRGDWPGLPLLRASMENEVPVGRRTDEVLAFFDDNPPATGHGSLALIAAYERQGRSADAQAHAAMTWLTQPLDPRVEEALLADYRDILAPLHEDRLDMLLWEGDFEQARRMLPRVDEGWRALAEARIALRLDTPGVDHRIEDVPAALADDPGLAYERFAWRDRRNRREDALELILAQEPDDLGRADAWSGHRRILARQTMRAGEPETAYRLAAEHGLVEGGDFADLEWLAGFIALTYLDEAETARDHFRRFRDAVTTPISLGRAGYWEGRAEEALGNLDAARAAYEFGAGYQTAFYGQMAAERAGLDLDPALLGRESYPDWTELDAAESSVAQAAEMLFAAGEKAIGTRFFVHLCESLTADEMGALADHLLRRDEPNAALAVGKYAAGRGIVLPRAYFPVVDLGVETLAVPQELALAIARRESEFNPRAISPVGARGLMQIMPATAQGVSQQLGLGYSADRLLTDPSYNARLGTAYLAALIERFGPGVAMVSAGYNAGPGRPAQWAETYGDPRHDSTDIVDWIEHIPFRETQNYVMRVAESLVVYRARLSGEVGPVRLTEALVAR